MDHEEEFLNTFFTQVTQLCFDKAKESVEKERESCRLLQMGPWGMLLLHLPQVAVAERSYTDLGFLHTKNKGFLRKDNSLKTMYEALRADLRRLEEMTSGTNAVGATVAEVSSQLCQFIAARIQLIDFYEKMYNMSINSKVMRHQDLLQSIEAIVETHSLSCSHLALTAIKAALTLECEILVQLIKAHVEVQNWRFLPSLMALYGAQTRMSAWERTLQSRESWKRGFGATFLKANQQPALYQWLVKLRSAILAKCSLYFHTTLSQQASPGEMRSIMSKQNVDYYHKLQSFQRKYDVIAVLIVFDSRGAENSGPGYKHPKREPDISESFSIVVSCPSMFMQKPSVHWDNIRKGIKERHADLLAVDKIVYNKSLKDLCSYAMYNIDPRMTLVTAFESSKQRDKESHVTSFMSDLCMQLRCNKVYECLKLSK
ncbi:KICSTOR complex protein C12orf66 homolog [Cephus cinctus]|uniref:KICSTOR complex protein C12orf66 homolog n=1 Tax=Cephus cinctus TaxID=211228 RepID=A0AAJ7CCG1_CEPCN|nr:KICSTOR complex protein C12orf66 homolog [Cephus cinctus]